MKISPTTYLHTFAITTIVLALVRCAVDFWSTDVETVTKSDFELTPDSLPTERCVSKSTEVVSANGGRSANMKGGAVRGKHKILSVPSYKHAFPDSNSVQMRAALAYGVQPVENRVDAEQRKQELVYVAVNPYYSVDPLRESIPYLVPRASVLLQDIGRSFYDSLYVKGVPLHQVIVTSVLRTEEDVVRLRRHNQNASENSCHRYGTTFDICYNRYVTVQTRAESRRAVRNDTLKWVLSEVLRDMREQGRCYVKYEVKQGCFHITTR